MGSMNMNPDWKSEMEKAKQELGSPGILAAYWAGAVVLLFLGSIVLGGFPGAVSIIINLVVIMIAAVPIALGAGWLNARKNRS